MGPGKIFFDLGQVNFSGSGWAGSAMYGLGLNLENFPLKMSNFQFFCFGSKNNILGLGQKVPRSKAGQPFIYCGMEARVESWPISTP